jgi:4'-phosphopantetheinyl transferase
MWDWPAAPHDLAIGSGEVHVWAAGLVLPPQPLSELEAILDSSERDRAARFVLPVHRDRFIAAHGVLRRLLGRRLMVDPREIQFVAGAQGKPALAPTMQGSLHFNLAHSGDAALIAIARGRDLGVDVEQVRPTPDTEAIAARFFSAGEQVALAALPAAERQAAFFDIWTRKEAWIKAIGKGLTFPLDQFTVSLGQGEEDCLLSAGGDPAVASQWRLRALVAPLGYAAAVAAEGRDWRLRLWGL